MAEIGIGSQSSFVSAVQNKNKSSSLNEESAGGGGGSVSARSFMDTLKDAIGQTNESLKSADKAAQDFAAGKAQNLHDVMISMEKADVALRTVTAVRGKIVEAYQEIMRMPV